MASNIFLACFQGKILEAQEESVPVTETASNTLFTWSQKLSSTLLSSHMTVPVAEITLLTELATQSATPAAAACGEPVKLITVFVNPATSATIVPTHSTLLRTQQYWSLTEARFIKDLVAVGISVVV
ncbi:MAG: hypothetical protein MSS61_03775 [Bacteroidales bacterium]|nr:hypothetical protein [Bacteroidales bacterium]